MIGIDIMYDRRYILLGIIRYKGRCSLYNCNKCPFYYEVTLPSWCELADDEELLNGTSTATAVDTKYQTALNLYVEEYGKDAELMEVLI